MIVMKKALPRRTFLRGMGVTLALPLLDAMVPAFTPMARAAALNARRLGFFYVPNGMLQDDRFAPRTAAGYEMPLTSEDPQLWAIGVRLTDLDAPFGKLIKEMSVDWHKSGKLLELEKKWGIKSSPYLVEQNKKLSGS